MVYNSKKLFSVSRILVAMHRTATRGTAHIDDYLISMPAVDGVLKLDTIRWRRRLKACSISFDSDAGSIRQNDPLPGSSCDLGTFTKKRLSERLCRIEFYNHRTLQARLHCMSTVY